ncbi:MAG: DNA mismatch endonuclease Vsr [Planctomycetes bacterium]|nr:DNA mismatch endonuclease Vsr [Planctomycetota bacterium]
MVRSADTVLGSKRSAQMRRVRRHGTAPELLLRSLLRGMGIRYQCNCADLPGRPDLANRVKGWAIFVHGCFWHGHRRCRRSSRLRPKTNGTWWADKIEANRSRDSRKSRELRRSGMRVLVVWECALRDPEKVRGAVLQFLDDRR